MIGHGLGHMVSNLIDSRHSKRFMKAGSRQYSFEVNSQFNQKDFVEQVDLWIKESMRFTPTAFDFSFDPRRGFFFRAVDWQFFSLHIVPAMVVPYLKYDGAKQARLDLSNACAISLQKSFKPSELSKMKRMFSKWARFFNQKIAAERLNRRVWTMNNHFVSYHLYDLIKSYGFLRYYSCRSLQRTIQKFTNLSKSKSQSIKGTDNVFVRLSYFKQYNDQLAKKDLYPARKEKPNSFRNHPLDFDGSQAQIWERFEDVDLGQVDQIAAIPSESIIHAITKYHQRLTQADNATISIKATLAASILKDDTVIQSKWHYGEYQNKRSNHFVILRRKSR
ncbi:hypothetical protein A0J61_10715 [Choanephora cucurbitarum]|uniref:Uncharacterized protein n=1 Tax=Choanephora cucurbitarum TaxID=101091 RepID=A0A1C7MXW1_9FUNG|nr:hypothetical protein A0J61_10715 [Choanephora cucurbitarum]